METLHHGVMKPLERYRTPLLIKWRNQSFNFIIRCRYVFRYAQITIILRYTKFGKGHLTSCKALHYQSLQSLFTCKTCFVENLLNNKTITFYLILRDIVWFYPNNLVNNFTCERPRNSQQETLVVWLVVKQLSTCGKVPLETSLTGYARLNLQDNLFYQF